MPNPADLRPALWLALTTALTFALFSVWPQLDLAVSAQFFDAASRRFPLVDWALAESVRMAVWNISTAMVLSALGLAGVATLRRPRQVLGVPLRAWAYVVAVYALGVGGLVENLLKRGWGRPRPPQIAEFGGEAVFSPVNVLSGQCARNCSFVSGEVAGAVALALGVAVVLAWVGPRLPPVLSGLLRGLAFAMPVAVMAQRLVSGRHFLSDVLIAGLVTLLVAALLAPLFRPFPAAVDNPADSP